MYFLHRPNFCDSVSHILITALPLFIFEHVAETSNPRIYRLYTEILPVSNGKPTESTEVGDSQDNGSGSAGYLNITVEMIIWYGILK